MRSLCHASWLAMFLLTASPAIRCPAEDFRIESRVFVGEATEPVNETTTLFQAGRVYDFLSNPVEVTVFDPSRERFLLLNPAKRQKAEVTVQYVTTFTATLKQRGQDRDDPLVQFMTDPRFGTRLDSAAGLLLLESEWMTYEVETLTAASDLASAQYTSYADAYAHLNTLTSPGHLPPFARLELNKALRQRGELPKSVTLTVTQPKRLPGKAKTVVIRSEHHVAWKLLESDRERIDRAGRWLAEFRGVDLTEYQRPAIEQAQR